MNAQRVRVRFPALYRKQRDLLFAPERFVWIEGATKSGKTHGCLSWFLYHAFHDSPGAVSTWVAPVHAQAKIAFKRAIRYLPADLIKANKSDQTIEVRGAGVMHFRSGKDPDHIYGEDNERAVVDEATRLPEESWEAVLSTLTATNGQARMIGNVKTRSNWHYKGCRAAAGKRNHRYGMLTCWDAVEAGVVSRAVIEEAREALKNRPAVFAALYECVPPDDGGNPFGYGNLKRNEMDGLAAGPVVAWGVDVAKAVDHTALVGLNEAGKVAAFHRFQDSWEGTFARVLELTAGAPMIVDATGVGDPLFERWQRARGIDPSYWAALVKDAGGDAFRAALKLPQTAVVPFKFSASSKQSLFEDLAIAIANAETAHPANSVLASELEAFEYTYSRAGVRYEAPIGEHDDGVDAYGLAWRLYSRCVRYRPERPKAKSVPLTRRRTDLNW